MKRFVVTLSVVVGLSLAYRIYTASVVPFTRSENSSVVVPVAGPAKFRSPLVAETARKYFPQLTWTHDAAHVWQRSDEAFLFAEQVGREAGEGNMVRMAPFAMIWKDPRRPDSEPYCLHARAARVQFENAFFANRPDSPIEMSENPGRIVWAALEGQVYISGPEAMSIVGRDFKFSEESADLYSDHPLEFHYGPGPENNFRAHGRAEGVTLSFTRSSEPVLGRDMPRVAGLSQIIFRKNITLEAALEQEGTPSLSRITCGGPFEYDVIERQAKFSTQVRVVRITNPETRPQRDTLDCEWMALEFEPDPKRPPVDRSSPTGLFDGLVFRQLRALWTTGHPGSGKIPVRITSQERDLTAVMEDLYYNASQRKALFVNDQKPVDVTINQAHLQCPRIEIQHGEQPGDLQLLHCPRPGVLKILDPRIGPEEVTLSWSGNVRAQPDSGIHRVAITGDAELHVPRRAALRSNLLTLWMDVTRLSEATSANAPRGQALPLRQAIAEGKVKLITPDMVLKTGRIEAVILPGQLPAGPDSTTGPPGRPQADSAPAASPWQVSGQEFKLTLLHDPAVEMPQLRRLTGLGNVVIEREPQQGAASGSPGGEKVVIRSTSLLVENEGETKQILTILGDPSEPRQELALASVKMSEAQIMGPSIVLDRAANRVDVEGRGMVLFPVNSGLDGEPLPQSTSLTIRWESHMEFVGKTATFRDKVTASLPDQQNNSFRVDCEELSADLDQAVSFTEPRNQATPTVERIRARHDVKFTALQFEGNTIVGRRDGSLAEFELTRSTGNFVGLGRGEINDWTLGGKVRLTPGDSAMANQPAGSSPPSWRFTHIEFAGQLDGNMHRREVTLHDRVRVLSAPVPQALEQFHLSQMTESTPEAKNAFALRCDKLRIVQRQHVDQVNPSMELYATENPELEAQLFRAVADELSFEERTGKFVLRGVGKNATLHLQKEIGGPSVSQASRYIMYIPSKPRLDIGESQGLSGGL